MIGIKELIKKYKVSLLIIFITFVILSIIITIYLIFNNKKIKIKVYENEIYKVQYDSTWKLKEKSDDSLLLNYKKHITLEFSIINLENNYLYMSFDEILDEMEYSIYEQNKDYGLIAKQAVSVTQNGYDGCQLLYENNEVEVMVMIAKKSDQLLVITYQSPHNYFDILLDSVKEIIHSFELLDKKYEITNMLEGIEYNDFKLSSSGIEYEKKSRYSFAHNNYLVEIEVPEMFKEISFNSTTSYLVSDDNNISLSASVLEQNVFELLESIKNEKFLLVDNKEPNKEATFTKINEDKYIYHVKYKTDSDITREYVYLISALRKDRVLFISVSSTTNSITKELIDSITVKETTRYAKNIYRNVVDGKLVNEMKYVHKDYTNLRKYSIITLYTPERYEEADYNNDKYGMRYFRYFYDEETNDYKVKLNYAIVYDSLSNITTVETYDYANYIKKTVDIKEFNSKKFDVYYYEYKKSGIINYAYILFYELIDGKKMEIKIESKNKINEKELKEITIFEIETLTMNN